MTSLKIEELAYDNPLISILIVNFNGKKYLGEILDNCIKSIFNNDYENYEILFIDNGSIDDSVEHIKKLYGNDKRLRIIKLDKNCGTTGAKNIGVKLSKGELLYILNTDIYLRKETLKKMNEVMKNNPDVGILSCKLVRPNGQIQTEGESFYTNYSLLGTVLPSLNHRLYMQNIEKRNNLNIVDWISGGALMIRKHLFNKVGPYDENYFMYSEEVDLSYKVNKLGYKVACITDYETLHYHKLTSKNFSKWQSDLVSRNQLLFMTNNFTGKRLALGLGFYFIGIFNKLASSLIKLDKMELKRGLSKIHAFAYVKKPPIIPTG